MRESSCSGFCTSEIPAFPRPAWLICLAASSNATESISDPLIDRIAVKSVWRMASSRRAEKDIFPKQESCSMAKCLFRPGARPAALKAASTSMVPVPQHGSCRGIRGLQGLSSTSAAARVSRNGASPFHVLYPRLDRASPEVLRRILVSSLRIDTRTGREGPFSSNRCRPVWDLSFSIMAFLVIDWQSLGLISRLREHLQETLMASLPVA